MMKHITLIAYTIKNGEVINFYQRCEWIYFWQNKSEKVSEMINALAKELDMDRQEIFTNIQVF